MEKMNLIYTDTYTHAKQGTDIRAYDNDHYNLLKSYEDTEISQRITNIRIKMTLKALKNAKTKSVLDFGCGTGYFIKQLNKNKIHSTYGFDILAKTVRWLRDKKIYYDITKEDQQLYPLGAITMWDVIEHLPNPRKILDLIEPDTYLLVGVPIIQNMSDLPTWKHFRPYEHLHYWTYIGFVEYMKKAGFELIDKHDKEIYAGRTDIFSFTFKKRGIK